jgi:hypothetical protein
MSELINMEKIPKTDRAKVNEATVGICCDPCEDKFPYGLRICFNKEELDKMPSLKLYKIEDKVIITAEASVITIRKNERQGEPDDCEVELQIEKISCDPVAVKPAEQMSPVEYRAAREENKL